MVDSVVLHLYAPALLPNARLHTFDGAVGLPSVSEKQSLVVMPRVGVQQSEVVASQLPWLHAEEG